MFIAVSHFGAREKTWHLITVRTHQGKGHIPHPREGLTSQTSHSLSTESTSQMPEVFVGWVCVLCVRVRACV